MEKLGTLEFPLDTLAQLETKDANPPLSTSQKTFYKRAKSKFLSYPIVHELSKLKSPLADSYKRSLTCADTVRIDENGKATSHYCKNRWCMVCSRIYTAKLINEYSGTLKSEIENPYFVTLTRTNVCAGDLRSEIKSMFDLWGKLLLRYKKRIERVKGYKFKGLIRLECTYNAENNTYHPHFHLLVNGKELAEEIREDWVLENRKLNKNCSPNAQDVREFNTQKDIIELFKYSTKLLSEKIEVGKKRNLIYIQALDVMYCAMRSLRLIRFYGISKLPDITEFTDEEMLKMELIAKIQADKCEGIYLWSDLHSNWVSDDGELLSNFKPSAKDIEFINNLITEIQQPLMVKPQNT